MLVMNVYCGKCQHCIGFTTAIGAIADVFCLNCEGAVKAEMERREKLRREYRKAASEVQCGDGEEVR